MEMNEDKSFRLTLAKIALTMICQNKASATAVLDDLLVVAPKEVGGDLLAKLLEKNLVGDKLWEEFKNHKGDTRGLYNFIMSKEEN